MSRLLGRLWGRPSAWLTALLVGAGGLGGLAACSAGFPAVIDPGEIAALGEGTPHVRRVRDLGSVHIGQAGPLLGESDGVITMGELLLIEGSGFGKQPAVGIGDRPAELRWRTAGGGIVIQVPLGSQAGEQPLWVKSGGQQSQLLVTLQRLAAVLDARRGQLHVVRIGGEANLAPTVQPVGQPLKLPGAHALTLSSDGAMAYVLIRHGETDDIAIVDLTAPQGPRVQDTRPLRHAAYRVLAAERAPIIAAIGANTVTLWDIREPRRPAVWSPAELPEGTPASHTAALDPSGTLLALAPDGANQVLFFDIKPSLTAVKPRAVGQVAVLPLAKQPLLRSLRFASDGETLWVTSGDNAASRPMGHQPTRLSAIAVGPADAQSGDRALAIHQTLELRDAGAPVQLTVGRAQPVAAGTTIRTPPEKATLFLTTVAPTVFDETGEADSALLRSDLSGNSTVVLSGQELHSGLEVTPDAHLAITTGCTKGPAGLTLTVANLAGGSATTIPLGAADADDLKPPFDHLTLVVQP